MNNTGSHCLLARIVQVPMGFLSRFLLLSFTKIYFVANKYGGAHVESADIIIECTLAFWQQFLKLIDAGALAADRTVHTLTYGRYVSGKKVQNDEWQCDISHIRYKWKGPEEQAASLRFFTHMGRSVYHPTSWQVVPHCRTQVSSSTARPLPTLAGEVTEKGEERCLHNEGYFSSLILVW